MTGSPSNPGRFTPLDDCLAFAAYLDGEGCPNGAFFSGFLFDVNDLPDPLHPTAGEEWAEIGSRWDCSIDLADFNSQAGALEESTEATALKGPTEASALEFVSDPANQPAFSERFSPPMFTEPRVAIEARIDGDCGLCGSTRAEKARWSRGPGSSTGKKVSGTFWASL